jgi:hypothetical protein
LATTSFGFSGKFCHCFFCHYQQVLFTFCFVFKSASDLSLRLMMGILSLMNGILFKVLQYALKLRIMVDDRSSVFDLEALVIANND